jgi:hypothetical protein
LDGGRLGQTIIRYATLFAAAVRIACAVAHVSD